MPGHYRWSKCTKRTVTLKKLIHDVGLVRAHKPNFRIKFKVLFFFVLVELQLCFHSKSVSLVLTYWSGVHFRFVNVRKCYPATLIE